MTEQMTKNWSNFGDVNPLEHGGIWVKQDEDSSNAFYIIKNELVDNDEDKQVIFDLYVDIEDSWIERESVLDYIGMNEENFDAVRFAIGCTQYYSFNNFGSKIDSGTLEETRQELKKFEIHIED